ncbi:MAG: site-2 protease family protein [Acidimicrobiales bacterium]
MNALSTVAEQCGNRALLGFCHPGVAAGATWGRQNLDSGTVPHVYGQGWRLGSIGGVEVRIDPSWILIAVLVAYSMFLRFDFLYDMGVAGTALLALVSALVFFASVLIHELMHSFTARALGIPVQGITLFLFGGATHARLDEKGPREEFLAAVVGPVSSFGLAGLLGAAAALAGGGEVAADRPIAGALGYLAWVNLALAVFNLVPGFPLDGGRVLRSAVWGATGSLARATQIAARVGQAIGYAMIAIGLLSMLTGGLSGLWLAAVGWFLSQAAQASLADQEIQRLLRGVRAEQVMARDLVRVPADASIEDAVHRYFLSHDHGAFPVVDDDGRVVGLVTLRRVRRVPPEARSSTLVRDAMVPIDTMAVARPETPIADIVRQFDDDVPRVLVTDGVDIVGIVTPGDVTRWLRRLQTLGVEPGGRA